MIPARTPSRHPTSRSSAWGILLVLSGINLFNYLDRYVISSLLPLMKTELSLSDARLGSLASWFMVSYLALSPVAGYLGDRYKRKYLIGTTVVVWSLATAATGLSRSYLHLVLTRALTGIGEAGYATVAPAIIADAFPISRRGSALSIFYAALPVGSALGFTLGGYWGAHFGWRTAFFLAGGPGLLLAIASLLVHEPERGASDGAGGRRAGGSPWRALGELAATRSYVLINLGLAAYTFSIGGLAFWAPTFFNRVRGIELSRATLVFGVFTVVGGFAGTLAGGALCDRLRARVPSAYVLVPALSLFAAFPPLLLVFRTASPALYWPLLLVAEVLLFMNTGPLNAAIVNVVLPERRAQAMALNLLVIHLLGDALSPLLIGRLSDAWGLEPASEVISLATLAAAAILVLGSRFLHGDERAIEMRLAGEGGSSGSG